MTENEIAKYSRIRSVAMVSIVAGFVAMLVGGSNELPFFVSLGSLAFFAGLVIDFVQPLRR